MRNELRILFEFVITCNRNKANTDCVETCYPFYKPTDFSSPHDHNHKQSRLLLHVLLYIHCFSDNQDKVFYVFFFFILDIQILLIRI